MSNKMEKLFDGSFGDYKFKNVWLNKTEQTKEQIIKFWQDQQVLPKNEKAEERALHVVFLMIDSQENIAGVCTAYPSMASTLGFNMYYFRCLIHPEYRQSQLARECLLRTWQYLNHITKPNEPEACKGLMVEVENPIINQMKPEAKWPYSGMVYVGRSSRGLPLRLRYFDQASILTE